MHIRHIIRSAFTGLLVNKVRSALTILGIVIGVTAIILIVSLGQGAQNLVLGQLQGMGADTIVIRPGQEPTGLSDVGSTLFSDSLTQRDVEALTRTSNVPALEAIAPAVAVSEKPAYEGETYRRAQVMGWSAEFMAEMFDIYPERGTLFDEADIKSRARVAVIGSAVAEELFDNEDPLGKSIKVRDQKLRVVGVLPSEGQNPFFNIDDVVVVPYTTAQSYLLGINHYHEIMVRVSDADLVDRSIRDVEYTLRQTHDIDNPENDDFYVVTQQGAIDQIGVILNVLTMFLASVVAISLVVGGIGVMNIMLVSVTERTREIGLRKALGATRQNILTQFLIEAVVLTGVGGIIGIALGALFGYLASIGLSSALNLDWHFQFPLQAAILGIGVSALVGVVFGIYPAQKASKKSPIEALRYE